MHVYWDQEERFGEKTGGETSRDTVPVNVDSPPALSTDILSAPTLIEPVREVAAVATELCGRKFMDYQVVATGDVDDDIWT